jgi:hemoglobin-like flavoprotein
MLDSTQVDLIQSTFDKVVPVAGVAAEVFYSRLFEIDPSLRQLFRGDMQQQGKKLMDALAIVVGNLLKLDRVMPGIRAMGARHARYGVKDEDYAAVGAALLWTLEHCLGDDFTEAAEDAWAAAYKLLANAMKGAAAMAVA